MRTLVFLFISSFIIGFSSCDFIQTKILGNKSEDTTKAYQARLDSLRRVDSIKEARQDSIRKARRQDSIARMDSIQQARQEKEQRDEKQYHIITGSFKTPQYADEFNQEMKSLYGYNSHIIEDQHGLHLVAVKSFDDYGRAVSALKNIKNREGFTAWLYNKESD